MKKVLKRVSNCILIVALCFSIFLLSIVTASAAAAVLNDILTIVNGVQGWESVYNTFPDFIAAVNDMSASSDVLGQHYCLTYIKTLVNKLGLTKDDLASIIAYSSEGRTLYENFIADHDKNAFNDTYMKGYYTEADRQRAWAYSFFILECNKKYGLTWDMIENACFEDNDYIDKITIGADNKIYVDDDCLSDDLSVDGDYFAWYAQLCADHYAPKNTADYISWRTDKRYNTQQQSLSAPALSFFFEGSFCGESTWTECFLVPWYTDGTTDYFSQYQFHFYQVVSEDDSGKRIITMYCDVWDMLNGGDIQTITVTDKLMDYRYMDFSVSTEKNRLLMVPYSTYTDYVNRSRKSSLTPMFTMTDNVGKNIVYSADSLTTANINDFLSCWQKPVTIHDEGDCSVADLHDTGYYVSNKQIYMNFDFVDLSQFTKEDVVTLTGDTFYDYTITNSTTGDSTTVYNYITNNYNYPDNGTGDSGEEGSGSASGNVDVDVNVNVDVNTGSDGGSMPVDVDLNNYLEQTPEQAKPITEFFSIFFDFLPPELLGLICLGVAVAIILRIWGR